MTGQTNSIGNVSNLQGLNKTPDSNSVSGIIMPRNQVQSSPQVISQDKQKDITNSNVTSTLDINQFSSNNSESSANIPTGFTGTIDPPDKKFEIQVGLLPKQENKFSNLSVEERINIAKNPETSPEDLHLLMKDKNVDVRCQIAVHPNTTENDLKLCCMDLDDKVRQSAALNHNTPFDCLALLACDEKENVRIAVAPNPNLTDFDLHMLRKDDSEQVRAQAELNPKVSKEIPQG
jgi:hypothetical protein